MEAAASGDVPALRDEVRQVRAEAAALEAELAELFEKNFVKYSSQCSKAVIAQGPTRRPTESYPVDAELM